MNRQKILIIILVSIVPCLLLATCVAGIYIHFTRKASTPNNGNVELSFTIKKDNFGKDIVVPPDMETNRPTEEIAWEEQQDDEGDLMLRGWGNPDLTDTGQSIVDNIELPDFSGNEKEKLIRHLATSVKWRLWREGEGKLFATRRFVEDNRTISMGRTIPTRGNWETSLHGWAGSSVNDMSYSYRILIGLEGPVWAAKFPENATFADSGKGKIKLKLIDDDGLKSCLMLKTGEIAIEIYEKSPLHTRYFTSAALKALKTEFTGLAESDLAESKDFDLSLIPEFSVRKGEREMKIRQAGQPGIYFVDAFVNPGAPGYVYIKAFEATRGTPLSSDTLKNSSVEYTGWSDNPEELFFYNTYITIYEGGWDWEYPARFELWFVPEDSTKSERKMMEKIFMISGYDF